VPQKSSQVLEIKTLEQVNNKNANLDLNFAALTNAFFAATIDMNNEHQQPRQMSGQIEKKRKK
jgi:hypothetical protein